MPLTLGVCVNPTGDILIQIDSSELAAFYQDPMIWCIYLMYQFWQGRYATISSGRENCYGNNV